MEINIQGLNKAEVLAELYNNAKLTATRWFKPEDSPEMTKEDAEALLKETAHFDYLNGRVLKIDLSGDSFNSWLYDRDNGEGAAEAVVKELAKETV